MARRRLEQSSRERRDEIIAGNPHERKQRDLQWWKHDSPHDAVFDIARRVQRQTAARRWYDFYYACLYDGSSFLGGAAAEFVPQTLETNIVKRQVDTYVAKRVKNRPVPMPITTGGNYSQQRRAKSLGKFQEGVLDQVEYWETRRLRIRDGAVWGDGFAHNYRVGRRLVHDRRFPWEFLVDPWEAQYGKPRNLIVYRYVDKLVLANRFPKYAGAISQAEERWEYDPFQIGLDDTSNMALVLEAWHLPSGDGAKDGAHVIVTSNATLAQHTYERTYFPFSKQSYTPGLRGFRGDGMVAQLAGLQHEVNSVGMRLQEAAYMTGTYVWAPPGEGIEVDVIDNGTLSVIRSQMEPKFLTPPSWHPQLFDYYMTLRREMPADVTGLSPHSTRMETPAGFRSGRAQRVHQNIEAEGLTAQGHDDERDVIDTCWQLFDLAEEIYAEGSDGESSEPYQVQVGVRKHGRSELQDLNWADVRIDRKNFVLRVFPTSFLASTPEDRFEQVQDMINAGFLSQDEATALLDFPDLQRVTNLRGAARRNIERVLERLLEAEDPDLVYEVPEAAWNLELCRALALQVYLEAKLDGAPEPNLRAVLQFAADAQNELTRAQTPPAEQGGGGPPEQLYAPPDEPPMPEGAVAPEAMPPIPGVQ